MLEHLINPKPKIALMGTYLALYDSAFFEYRKMMDDFLSSVAQALSPSMQIMLQSICTNEKEATQFTTSAEKAESDAVLLLSLGYTNSLSVSQPLIDCKLPLVVFNTQIIEEVTQEFTFDDMLVNHGMQGIQDITCVLVKAGRRFNIVTGLIDQEDTVAALVDHLTVARAYNQIRHSSIAYMGEPMPGMGDAEFDHAALEATFGIRSSALDPTLLAEGAKAATQDEIDRARRFDEEHFEIAADMTIEDHERSLRQEIALRKIVEQKGLSGLTLSFDYVAEFPGIETIPFLGVIKLMGEGMSYGGEGDLLVTAGGTIARCLCDEVNFTEMYTMDFKENAVLNTHMAEGNWRMCRKDRKPKLLKRQFTLAECEPFASLHFSLEPGAVTLFDLTITEDGQFHLITLEARVADFAPLEGMELPNFKLTFSRDIREILNEYSLLGGTHHLSLVYGKHNRRFELLAKYFGCPYSRIATE